MVIFDRSWDNRAGVERVMGFLKEEQAMLFLEVVPLFEKLCVQEGIILLKYWLEVSPEEQTRRLEGRNDDGRKIGKLSPMDLQSYKQMARLHQGARRDVRSERYAMGAVVRGKIRRQKAGAAEHHHPPSQQDSLKKEAPRVKVELPKRQKEGKYKSPDFPLSFGSRGLLNQGMHFAGTSCVTG